MIKAIILDFDGLILDTETVWYSIFKGWLADNYDYDLSILEFTQCVGSNNIKMFKDISNRIGREVDPAVLQEHGEPIFIEKSNLLPLLPGVHDLIKQAKQMGIKIALATSSKKERPLYHLDRLNILQYFDAITTSSEVDNVKPKPDLFLRTLEKLGIEPHEAVIFEDSNNGLIAGNKAGVPVIIVPNNITTYSPFEDYAQKISTLEGFDLVAYAF